MTGNTRVVVIGHGMVAVRFVEELHRRAGDRFAVTVLGEEPYEAYNRLLLSDVVAGRTDLATLTLPEPPPGVLVHRGQPAAKIDRDRRVVVDADGHEHPYDVVVLATGARPIVPKVAGLSDGAGESRGIRALRTVDDARDLIATAARVEHMTVVGGGLLGVELACGLRRRGVEVTVVHLADYLMERQLDAASGRVLAASLTDLGIDVHVGVQVSEVVRSRGAVTGVRLSSGRSVTTDQVVLSIGVEARDELAAEAGIPCRAGVLVGPDLRSPEDPSVAAIGDCARTAAGCPGLLAPGYQQAERLAADLAGAAVPDVVEHSEVVRLKAAGVEAVVLGSGVPADPYTPDAPRVISLIDPRGRRAVQIALRDERIAGAVCVGSPKVAAGLTQAYLRPGDLPLDPARLLVTGPAGAAAPAADPTAMPNSATVCNCNGVTKGALVAAYGAGDRTVDEAAARTRCGTGCGGCRSVVEGVLDWMAKVDPDGSAGPASRAEAAEATEAVAAGAQQGGAG